MIRLRLSHSSGFQAEAMRFFTALLLATLASSALAMFRSSSRGMATVDVGSGDVMWVPMPRQVAVQPEYVHRRCVFCRGYNRR
ncbi:unnamed protein product [Caenorhabditis auriculariae]|uniref:Uncharacterized protein n=1 Tax=Caenorhabditis auriculariae TaxID=2777116 RepID=A0A8S1HZA5_9PELO|nr:unnamed protein product [Caenorhabditis auriculariae]